MFFRRWYLKQNYLAMATQTVNLLECTHCDKSVVTLRKPRLMLSLTAVNITLKADLMPLAMPLKNVLASK